MGVLIADAVDAYHLRLVDFAPSTVSKFRSTFPPYYQCANPMDLTGSAKTDDMLKAGKLALEDPNIDAVIMGVQPIAPGFADPDKLAEILVEHFGPGKTQKPFLVVEFGGKHNDDRVMRTIMKEKGMAVYPGAEEALRALDKLAAYTEYLDARRQITSQVGSPRECSLDVPVAGHPRDHASVRQGAGEGPHDADGGGGLRRVLAVRDPDPRVPRGDARRGRGGLRGDAAAERIDEVRGEGGVAGRGAAGAERGVDHPQDRRGGRGAEPEGPRDGAADGGGAAREVQQAGRGVSRHYGERNGPEGTRDDDRRQSRRHLRPHHRLRTGRRAGGGAEGRGVQHVSGKRGGRAVLAAESEKHAIGRGVGRDRPLERSFRGQPALNKPLFAQYISSLSQIMEQCPQVSEIDINPLIQSHDGSMVAVDSVFRLKHL